jgi:hypothetical protein
MSNNRANTQSFGSWWTPKRTLEHVRLSKGDDAQNVIMQRLMAGVLFATATSGWSKAEYRGPPVVERVPAKVPTQHWVSLADGSFWNTGDARFVIPDFPNSAFTIWCHDVRFDPAEIERMFPAPPSTPVPDETVPPPQKEAEQNKPAVSSSRLEEWAALYVNTYAENEDTGDKAWESAKGMFQGKLVTRKAARDAVAKLRSRKPGRKPTAK